MANKKGQDLADLPPFFTLYEEYELARIAFNSGHVAINI